MHDDCGTIVLRGPYWFAFFNFVALNSVVVVGGFGILEYYANRLIMTAIKFPPGTSQTVVIQYPRTV